MPEPHDELTARRERLESLEKRGIDAFPSTTSRTHTVAAVVRDFQTLESTGETLMLVGRVRAIRRHGGASFLVLQDGTASLQLYVTVDDVGEDAYALLDLLDLGDFLQVTGVPFVTKRGEQSLRVMQPVVFLAKALRPLPEKWHGLADTEIRLRKRYLDMLVNTETKDRIIARSRVISALRDFMNQENFLEVETPTLQPMYGGGFARPFTTHHNALDARFFLRISDEMYLKRLLVGGFEQVYEITKVFRNEGIDRDHNPEFTMFEAQAAYRDYRWGMDFFETVVAHITKAVTGATTVAYGSEKLSFERPWKRITVVEAVQQTTGLPPTLWQDPGQARTALEKILQKNSATELSGLQTGGELLAFAFEELVEASLLQPTIVYDYPVAVSPLAKRATDPAFTERFEVFVMGSEIGNNYSELNNPIELMQRFVEEKKRQAAGFVEAHQEDTDYLEAIEHGMPPACGLAIGIDRLVMFLTNAHAIKDVIAFPTLRPERD